MTETRSFHQLPAEYFEFSYWEESGAALLPIEARGLFRELLTQAWRRGARLVNDPIILQQITRCTAEEWVRCWPKVEPFWRVEGANLVNEHQRQVYDALLAEVRA